MSANVFTKHSVSPVLSLRLMSELPKRELNLEFSRYQREIQHL